VVDFWFVIKNKRICPLKTWSWNHDRKTSYTVTTRAYLMWYSLSFTRRRTIFYSGHSGFRTWTKIVQNIFLSKRLADWLIDWLEWCLTSFLTRNGYKFKINNASSKLHRNLIFLPNACSIWFHIADFCPSQICLRNSFDRFLETIHLSFQGTDHVMFMGICFLKQNGVVVNFSWK
jgi:hypothetical protein